MSSIITKLRKKLEAKQKKLKSCEAQLAAAKNSIKSLKKDISEIESEISNCQLQQLSNTLNAKGITTADIEEAIAAGIFEKSTPATTGNAINKTEEDTSV